MTRPSVVLAGGVLALAWVGLAQGQGVPPSRSAQPTDYSSRIDRGKDALLMSEGIGLAVESGARVAGAQVLMGSVVKGVPPSRVLPTLQALSNVAQTGADMRSAAAAVGSVGASAAAVYECSKGAGYKCDSAKLEAAGSLAGHFRVGGDYVAPVFNAASAYTVCSNEGASSDCIMKGLDATASAGGVLGLPGKLVGASYTAGKMAGTGLDSAYTAVSGQSLGADVYDWTDSEPADPSNPRAWADFERTAGRIRGASEQRYQTAATDLQQKQVDFDQQQAAAAQAQADAAAQQASMAQLSSTMSAIAGGPGSGLPGPVTPVATQSKASAGAELGGVCSASKTFNTKDGCHPGHDETSHPGGCHCG